MSNNVLLKGVPVKEFKDYLMKNLTFYKEEIDLIFFPINGEKVDYSLENEAYEKRIVVKSYHDFIYEKDEYKEYDIRIGEIYVYQNCDYDEDKNIDKHYMFLILNNERVYLKEVDSEESATYEFDEIEVDG